MELKKFLKKRKRIKTKHKIIHRPNPTVMTWPLGTVAPRITEMTALSAMVLHHTQPFKNANTGVFRKSQRHFGSQTFCPKKITKM